ncbi:hypothetical protein [Acetobacter estunensis]|nr:hypothetical protein [Acetobacter estunensis]
MARKVNQDVPVITVRALIIMHIVLAAFIGVMAWMDWSVAQ